MGPNADQPKSPEAKPGSKLDAKEALKSLPMSELKAKLGASPDGLSQAEAQKRLTQYGPNEIEEKQTNPILKFLSYFWGPIPWMIEVAVILSGLVRHWPDFAIILLLLLANAVVEPVEVTPQIARRAYELYEQRGRRDGQAGQDWLEAEREIRDESPK